MSQPKHIDIIIVGAGCFGVSTAFQLLQRGYENVTILDRSDTLPAPDAASNDINRIVRSSYADPFYTQLAREAIALWKDKEFWGDSYQESGVLVLGSSDQGDDEYANEAYKNDLALGADIELLNTAGEIAAVFPPSVRLTGFESRFGYLNRDGGWADAGKGLSRLIGRVRALGGKFVTGKVACDIIRCEDGSAGGILCSDGSKYEADLTIIATGSWTPSTFPQLDLGRMCLATGYSVFWFQFATIQLSEDEAKKYKACPVVLDFSTGFYIFPPNDKHVVKMAIHAAGYTHADQANGSISTPRTLLSHPNDGLCIPKDTIKDLRKYLKDLYPELAMMPFSGTRMCWYNDSPDGDWVIGRYPGDKSLILATAGSGHAYKFLPVVGRLVVDLLEDQLAPPLTAKFAVDRPIMSRDTSRIGQPIELDPLQLCSPQDLAHI
ncbi:hypothetical protein CVT24_006182 [Panaeolus cyanescens]|uniref:FAD dependent oxidoreductase domain-containing protein n=1 Tax=Panaeolus cyanescens TaxID=181874 RepID=A0A409V8P1_9AGAR|nr:hypothetical protein CVT24_006182 [Panaeolus cyanescens]